MSKYRITIEGKTYELEIEFVPDDTAPQVQKRKDYREYKGAPRDANINVIDPSLQRPTVKNAGAVTTPMPGTVIRIEKKVGDAVKAGELVLILEAMKMENEILAPTDGTITVMNCKEGGTVAGGEVLFEVK